MRLKVGHQIVLYRPTECSPSILTLNECRRTNLAPKVLPSVVTLKKESVCIKGTGKKKLFLNYFSLQLFA